VLLDPIKAMDEIGIDISGQHSKSVDEFSGQNFDYVTLKMLTCLYGQCRFG